ncbi:MAG: site-specific integrase [Ktedonobacteraceae bacterium]
MPNRGHGEGSIYKRKDGRWTASISIEHGKRKYIYGKTRKEVQNQLNIVLHDQQKGTLVTAPKQTVADYFQYWLKVHRQAVRPRTHERYEEIVRLHIVPTLGNIQIQKLTGLHLQNLYSQKREDGLSPTTITAIHNYMHTALDNAVRLGLVSQNVCDKISPPRKVRKEIKPLTPEQARKLLETAKGHPQEALFVLALATGMRRGELLGLKWQDVDLANGVIHINHVLSRTPTKMGRETGDRYIEAETKTERSRRSILIAGFALEALKHHLRHQLAAMNVAGDDWEDHDYVFCTPLGKHLDPGHNVLVQLKILLKKADLPDIRFHDLRHSAATLLLSMDVHPKVVQEILGHSEISMTMDTYSHVLPTMQRDAMERLNGLFLNDNQEKEVDRSREDVNDTPPS